MLIPIRVQELRSRIVYVDADDAKTAADAVEAKFNSGEMSLDESDVDGRDVEFSPMNDSEMEGETADFSVGQETKTGFKWTCTSDDGYQDESKTVFADQSDCYEDMMKTATLKMRWNIEWEDVTSDTPLTDGEDGVLRSEYSIGWDFHAFSDRIVMSSYSGTYTYRVQSVR